MFAFEWRPELLTNPTIEILEKQNVIKYNTTGKRRGRGLEISPRFGKIERRLPVAETQPSDGAKKGRFHPSPSGKYVMRCNKQS